MIAAYVGVTPREHILKRKKYALAGGSQKQVQDAAELINKSEKPVLYVGGGAKVRLHPRLELLVDGRFMVYATRQADGFGALLPVRAGSRGNRADTASSPGSRLDSSGPRKKSAAAISRVPPRPFRR